MTYQDLVKLQFDITETEYNKYSKQIVDVYRDAYTESSELLQEVYNELLAGVPAKEYLNKMLEAGRLGELTTQIQAAYRKAANAAGKSIGEAGELAVSNMYYRSKFCLEWSQSAYGIIPVLDEDLIEISVYGTEKLWQEIADNQRYKAVLPQYGTLSNLIATHKRAELEAIKTELYKTVYLGQNYRQAARNMKDAFNGFANNALRTFRTDGNRNLNSGNYIATQKARAEGVELIREWDTTFDIHTRETHARADGQKEDEDGLFQVGVGEGPYPCQISDAKENYNCRCSVISYPPDLPPTTTRARNPVKEYQWENATPAERRAGELADGTKIYSRSQQTDIISNTSFPEWMKINNLQFNRQGKIILAGG